MATHYLLRLDDACEVMDHENWRRIELLLDKYNVRPLIMVIPNDKDYSQKIIAPHEEFWLWLKKVESKGWEICMHGNTHVYYSESGGVNPVQKRSEFAGLTFENQCEAIAEGISKFKKKGFNPRIFAAPSHTFDKNTLMALSQETNIQIISDTIAFLPYRQWGFIFIPQQMSVVRKLKVPGIFTFCYHPSSMVNSDFDKLERFLQRNA
jgi:predicted deacetylase